MIDKYLSVSFQGYVEVIGDIAFMLVFISDFSFKELKAIGKRLRVYTIVL